MGACFFNSPQKTTHAVVFFAKLQLERENTLKETAKYLKQTTYFGASCDARFNSYCVVTSAVVGLVDQIPLRLSYGDPNTREKSLRQRDFLDRTAEL